MLGGISAGKRSKREKITAESVWEDTNRPTNDQSSFIKWRTYLWPPPFIWDYYDFHKNQPVTWDIYLAPLCSEIDLVEAKHRQLSAPSSQRRKYRFE